MTGGLGAPRIDCHVHLAGVGTDDSGCWISPAFEKRITFRLLRMRHGMSASRASADADWAADVAERVRGSELTHAVVLGFDGVYRHGRLDRGRTQMVVPAEWVFRVCRAHPELLPGPSINPHRADALERLEECIEGGAVLIKWLPATQGIDPADPALAAFYRRCAEARLPILTHSGGTEGTFAQVAPALKDLRRILPALRAGVPMIVAHTGAPVAYARDPDQVPLLRTMMAEFPHLWVDNSGMANPSRFQHLPRYARSADLVARTLHGSDFPVPSNAFWYARRLGMGEVARLERIRNRMQRDIEIKRALGYPDGVLTRAASVLPNLERWIGR
ncbi:MAG TPA: amidohydrolase family protein [Longimicrobium sp.]|jgi:predicted TIM-barrel fold metal-dependent hydrolase|uniref:amidohydrolase family protein n=1 Tax=Longimicrobium sp. TaxID=2029185 RepID=UPI002EDAB59D